MLGGRLSCLLNSALLNSNHPRLKLETNALALILEWVGGAHYSGGGST